MSVCIDCGTAVVLDEDTYYWTGDRVWIDPDAVDGADGGRCWGTDCPATDGDPHRVVEEVAA